MRPRTFALTMLLVAALCAHLHRLLHQVEKTGALASTELMGPSLFDSWDLAARPGRPPSRRAGDQGAGSPAGGAGGKGEAGAGAAEAAGSEARQAARLQALRDALAEKPPGGAAWLKLREGTLADVRAAVRKAAQEDAARASTARGAPEGRRPAVSRASEGIDAWRDFPMEDDAPVAESSGPQTPEGRPASGKAGRRPSRAASPARRGRPAPPRPRLSPDFDGRFPLWASWLVPAPGPASRAARPREARKAERPARARKWHYPPTLKGWLGRPLKPPSDKTEAPDMARLEKKYPASLPDGGAVRRRDPGAAEAEALMPPDEYEAYPGWLAQDKRDTKAGKPHWHSVQGGPLFFHSGRDWGRPLGSGWAWFVRGSDHWWTRAEASGQRQALVRHGERWWWRTQDGWFLLHGGQPWAWRYFPLWRRAGFIQPSSGVRIVYSSDGVRIALITGRRVDVFYAGSGAWLGSFVEERR